MPKIGSYSRTTFLRMNELEGVSYRQIAEERGISLGNLRRRVQNEKEKLRAVYSEN